jgi:hypothetical protein
VRMTGSYSARGTVALRRRASSPCTKDFHASGAALAGR